MKNGRGARSGRIEVRGARLRDQGSGIRVKKNRGGF